MLLCAVLYLCEAKWPKQYFLNGSLSLQLFQFQYQNLRQYIFHQFLNKVQKHVYHSS